MGITLLAQQGGGGFGNFLPLIAIFALFYFLLIRPQQRRARAQKELHASIAAGDIVVTIGGFHGTVVTVDEQTVLLELAPGNVVTLSRGAIAKRQVEADVDSDTIIEE